MTVNTEHDWTRPRPDVELPAGSTQPIIAPAPPGELTPLVETPTFSVVVAAYQVADKIADALRSVLDQTFAAHELIVVDDGSTDDLEQEVARFTPPVRFERRQHRGAAATMNAGAQAATGDYVCFIGADDVFLPERLAALRDLATARPDLDILTTDAWVSLGGDVFRRFNDPTYPFEGRDQRRTILQRNFIFGHAAVRRERFLEVGGFDETIFSTSDWELWARMILGGSAVGSVNEPLAAYRLHEKSLSANRTAHERGRLTTLARILSHDSLTEDEREIVQRRAVEIERDVVWRETKQALVAGDAEGPGRARLVLGDAAQAPSVRAKALVGALSPGLARMILAHTERRYWFAAGDLRIRRS